MSALLIPALIAGAVTIMQPVEAAGCAPAAKLLAFDGAVSIKPKGKVLKVSPGKLPRDLCAGDEVHTFEGRAEVSDGRYNAVLDKFSVVTVGDQSSAQVNGGRALFDVRKRPSESGVQIRTRLSVIGVKGTRFLVEDSAQPDKPQADAAVGVVLDEGVVDVASTQGPVKLFRETPVPLTPEQEYERFVRQHQEGVEAQKKEFAAYKAQVQREFVAFVESLTLNAGKELVLVNGEAVERDIPSDSALKIKQLRDWAPKH